MLLGISSVTSVHAITINTKTNKINVEEVHPARSKFVCI
jgi:hypothetical protein